MSVLMSPSFYTNDAGVDAWIAAAVDRTFALGYDGIVLDIEGGKLRPRAGGHGADPDLLGRLQRFGCKLRAALHSRVPGSVLVWTLPLFGEDEAPTMASVGRSQCAGDLYAIMAYDAGLPTLGSC